MLMRLRALSLGAERAIKAVSGNVRINALDNSAVVYLPDWTILNSWRDNPEDENCKIIHIEIIGNIILTRNLERRTLILANAFTNTFGSKQEVTIND